MAQVICIKQIHFFNGMLPVMLSLNDSFKIFRAKEFFHNNSQVGFKVFNFPYKI